MLLVLTDLQAARWADGSANRALVRWARAVPTAVVHVLPDHVWARTGTQAHRVRLTAPGPAAPNATWSIRHDDISRPRRLPGRLRGRLHSGARRGLPGHRRTGGDADARRAGPAGAVHRGRGDRRMGHPGAVGVADGRRPAAGRPPDRPRSLAPPAVQARALRAQLSPPPTASPGCARRCRC
ncbi:hypothetical protein ACR6C2_13965 [Streptomyces sp. INA 01156]